ncbi:hypothetical protein NBRC3255_2506 [Gluconobacter thailandicus NBRC 3255]|nr:hypothetical protein NBRC3255_2506 [Gluconobacter thailandicus NBRC 3255]
MRPRKRKRSFATKPLTPLKRYDIAPLPSPARQRRKFPCPTSPRPTERVSITKSRGTDALWS